MEIGSKSNPNAHLFAYDQKFRESTNLHNYPMKMSASKEFTDATRLSTRMELKALPNLTRDDDRCGLHRHWSHRLPGAWIRMTGSEIGA